MTDPKVSGVRWVKERPYARMRVRGVLYSVPLGALGTDAAALAARRDVIATQLRRLDERGRLDVADRLAAAMGEATTPEDLQAAIGAVDLICERSKDLTAGACTVRELGEQWVSGELARRHPDHVSPKKNPDADRHLLTFYVYPVIGDMPVAAVSLEDCERVMRAIPAVNPHRTHDPQPLSVATRRHIAQAMHRLFGLARYPMRLIEESPVPRGFLPKLGAPKPKQYLYPDEEARLLGCERVPLVERLAYGVITREGLRYGEALALRWSDIDLERGVLRLDANKTGDARSWAMDPEVVKSLTRWRQLYRETARPFEQLGDDKRQAFRLREHLRLAGVDRSELFETTEARARLRAHDLRATFVTVSLANGKSETWVADRTGHKSSAMIARYRRAARTLADVGAGPLRPMFDAIAWAESSGCQLAPAAEAVAAESSTVEALADGSMRPISNQTESAPHVAAGREVPPEAVHAATYGDTVGAPVGENAADRDRPIDRPRPKGRSVLARRTISGALVDPKEDA